MTKRRTIEFDTDTVFARIREKPVRWVDLAGSGDSRVRRRLRPIVEELIANGVVKFVRISGQRYLALATWVPTKEQQLQELYDRCRAIDGCMVWADHIDPKRGPVAYAPVAGSERSVRRRIWGLFQRTLDYSHTVAMTCENPDDCVLYEHMKRVTRGAKMKGKRKTMAHRHAIALAKRKTAKLDEAKVAQILASEKSGRGVARELDVSSSTAHAVRNGDRWRNYRASPFPTREAANDAGRARA